MAMAWVWTGMVAVSVVYGWFNGTIPVHTQAIAIRFTLLR